MWTLLCASYSQLGGVEFVIVTIIILILVTSAVRLFVARRSPVSQIPSPPGWPILRHMLVRFSGPNRTSIVEEWVDKYAKNGMIRYDGTAGFGLETIVVTNPDDVKKVLLSESHKYTRCSGIEKVLPLLKGGVLSVQGKDHSWQRKLVAPTFMLKGVMSFVGTFHKHTEELVQVWRDKIQASKVLPCQIEVMYDMEKVTFDITGETVFGHQFKSFTDKQHDLGKAFQTSLAKTMEGKIVIINLFFSFLKRIFTFKCMEELDNANEFIREYLLKVMAFKTIKYYEKTLKKYVTTGGYLAYAQKAHAHAAKA